MTITFPEHRVYTYLAFLQILVVMIGTFAVRLATAENFRDSFEPAPELALWVRHWGFLLLLLPVGWLVWTLRAERSDIEEQKTGLRLAVGITVTILLIALFWMLWERSSLPAVQPLMED